MDSVPVHLVHSVGASVSRQTAHSFLWAPVVLGVGVGAYFAAKTEPDQVVLGVLLLCSLALWGVIRRFSSFSVLTCGLFICVLGMNLASWRAHSVAAPVLKYRYYGPVEGRVVSIDRSASLKPRYTLDQVTLSRIEPGRTPKYVRISGHGPEMVKGIQPGDTIITTGHLGPPPGPVEPGSFDFQRHLWFKQLGALGYTRMPILRSRAAEDISRPGPWMRLQQLRHDLSNAIKTGIGGREGPFAAAIITGDRSDLDPDALNDLRSSNLAHLLAISGLHMGLLTGSVFAVVRLMLAIAGPLTLRADVRKIAAVSAFIAALIYLGISGASIATQRAFIMVCVMLLAVCLDRPALSLRAVALAAIIVLCLTPEALFGPGFQMSFAATLALVAVFGALRDTGFLGSLRGPAAWGLTMVLSSAVAGAATAPYAAAHFNQIAQYGLLANVLSVPIMGLVVMPGALIAAIGAPIGLEGAGLWIMRHGLAWILGVAEYVAGLGGSTRGVPSPGPMVLPLLTMGGLIMCLWQGRGRLVGALPVAASIAIWASVDRPDILISESGRLVGVETAKGRALNKDKGESFSARVWLENDGDPVTQEIAAQRGLESPNQLAIEIGSHFISYDARAPGKLDLAQLCKADLTIVPRLESSLPSRCKGLTALDFQQNGSMSLRLAATGLELQTSRARQGTRLWGIAAQTD